MKIDSADCFDYSLPLQSELRLGSVALTRREGVLFRITCDDGRTGWGEAAPLSGFSKESLSEARVQLTQLAKDITQYELDIAAYFNEDRTIAQIDNNLFPSVQFALESALAELWSAHAGKPIAELFGLVPRNFVLVNGLLAGNENTIIDQAAQITVQQCQAVKIKIGDREPEQAVELLNQVTKIIPASTALRLDINRQWNFKKAALFASLIDGHESMNRIEYIEEPVDNREDLKKQISESNLPIALDETILEISPDRLGEYVGATAVILKPTLLGGLKRAIDFARAAKSLGMKVVLSSSFESDLATSTLASFASVVCDEQTPCGFDTLKWFTENLLARPPVISNGRITFDDKHSGGMVVRDDILRKVTNV